MMDTNQYLEVFIDESKEHLQSVNSKLLELEKNSNDISIVNEIFRSAHTLKGMSATMGYEDLANLTHKMENVLDGIRNQKIIVNTEVLDMIFESVDHLEAMILSIAEGGDGKRDVKEAVKKLQQIENGELLGERNTESPKISVEQSFQESTEFNVYEQTVLKQSQQQKKSKMNNLIMSFW